MAHLASNIFFAIVTGIILNSCSNGAEENNTIETPVQETEINETQTKMTIEELLAIENRTEAIIELDEQINEKSEYGQDLSKLTEAEKVVLFVENLEREINNGGFHQFYANSSGDYAHETYDALITIGAVNMANIVNEANSQWPDKTIPSNSSERMEILDKIEDQAEESWNECDSKFYEYPDDIIELLFTFVEDHKGEF